MESVRVESLSKTFGRVQALQDLTLTVGDGCVGLLGPNGAGKSTLLKVLLGLVDADSGTARVRGIDVTASPLEVRRRVGYMPEMDAYVEGLTGAQSAEFAGILNGMPRSDSRRRSHEILHYVGLGDARYLKVDEYSTGMRQRLRMAQALVHDPELILLDEPTNGLDPAGRDEVLALVRDLARTHRKSVLLCTHLLHDVEAVCDHVLVLRSGRLVLEGTLEELRRVEEGTLRVRVAGDRAAFEVALAAAGVEILERGPEDLHVRLPAGGGPRTVFGAAAQARCAVRELSGRADSLEGVFLRAVEGGG